MLEFIAALLMLIIAYKIAPNLTKVLIGVTVVGSVIFGLLVVAS